MFCKIDFWLLGKLEKFSHWFQRLTGKNCFWLAKISLIGWGISLVVGFFNFIIKTKELSDIILSGILILLIFIVVFISLYFVKLKEQLVMQFPEFSNPFKIIDYEFRAITLFITLILTLILLVTLLTSNLSNIRIAVYILTNPLMWYALEFYFSACDPLPPGKSQIKAWKEKLAGAMKNVFLPAPRPAPQLQKA